MNRSETRIWLAGGLLLLMGVVLELLARSNPLSAKSLSATVSVVLVGVGASILAASLATYLFSRQVFGLNLSDAVAALRGTSQFSRSHQSVALTIERVGDVVRVEAVHTFMLHLSGLRPRNLSFSIYTDVGSGSGGGFESVKGPDGKTLSGEPLQRLIKRQDSGKIAFTNEYRFDPRAEIWFTNVTWGEFDLSDRLIWTVEHVSSDFALSIMNRAGPDAETFLKINHHRESNIVPEITVLKGGTKREYDFLGEVLPYQGFELVWRFT